MTQPKPPNRQQRRLAARRGQVMEGVRVGILSLREAEVVAEALDRYDRPRPHDPRHAAGRHRQPADARHDRRPGAVNLERAGTVLLVLVELVLHVLACEAATMAALVLT